MDMRSDRRLDGILSDVAYASRSLRRAPGLLVAVVLTLAVGVGANAAVYSVVHSLLLQPPPYRAADRLVFLWAHMGAAGLPRAQLAGPEIIDFQSASTLLESIGAIRTTSAAIPRGGMRSTTLTVPSGASHSVSSTSESPRYRRVADATPPAGATCQRPASGVSSSAAKQAGESKRGRHSQSIDPWRPTRAAVWRSPMTA